MNSPKTTAALLGAALALLVAQHVAAATPDAWITTKAKMALLTTADVPGTAINVDTVNGQVTLHGTVATPDEKTKAEATVRDIDGVTGVRNLLQVVAKPRQEKVSASDAEITMSVKNRLAERPALSDVSVQSVNNGVVLLAGDVKTLGAHLEAVQVAAGVPGVRRVSSEIKSPNQLGDEEIYSDRPAQAGDAPKGIGARTSDMLITSDIKMRLLADERTPGMAVNVDTNDGVVTLFGMVESQGAKAAAEEDARKVSGVQRVVNDLQVVPESKQTAVKENDEDVKANVEAALAKRDDLRQANIDVEVSNGVARLTGTVPSQATRLAAAVVTRTAQGVRAVRDELRVSQ
jgi:hyperosmotically inducible protein